MKSQRFFLLIAFLVFLGVVFQAYNLGYNKAKWHYEKLERDKMIEEVEKMVPG